MPSAGNSDKDDDKTSASTARSGPTADPKRSSIFAVPPPVKRVFDRFPLVTYPPNELPLRAPRQRRLHRLYIWARDEASRPSFNPSCLKWQTYLRMSGVRFEAVGSSNHASPSGALPFLLPAASSDSRGGDESAAAAETAPVSAGKLQRWAIEHGASAPEESGDVRYEAYLSLVEHNIRRAWLHSLYLTPNLDSHTLPSYVPASTTSSTLIRLATAYELQTAARAELQKHSSPTDADRLYKDALEAFLALEALLAASSTGWFFGTEAPGLFDAAVFSYTHLILDDSWGGLGGWKDGRLRELMADCARLKQHSVGILQRFYD